MGFTGMSKYAFLNDKISERGIKKAVIARAVGISSRALANKLNGKTPFKWPEVQVIQARFFPDIEKDTLFSEEFETKSLDGQTA